MKDPVFGELTYDCQWEKTESLCLFNRDFKVQIIVQTESDESPRILDIQRKAYEEYKNEQGTLFADCFHFLREYCESALGVSDCREDTFFENSMPVAVFFSITGDWGVLFDSIYDPDDGIALVRSNCSWVVGSQDILI